MNENKNDLKVYFFEKVPDSLGMIALTGIFLFVGGIIAFLANNKALTDNHGDLTNIGIIALITVTVVGLGGLIVAFRCIALSDNFAHGFMAERDGHAYVFTINPQRLKDGSRVPNIGKIGKAVNGVIKMQTVNNYYKQMDEDKESMDFYNEVNTWLDENYSFFYRIRDLESNEFSKYEKKLFMKEFNQIKEKSESVL